MAEMTEQEKVSLLQEHRELISRCSALYEFIKTEKFKELDRETKKLLKIQLKVMSKYRLILQKRIFFNGGYIEQ